MVAVAGCVLVVAVVLVWIMARGPVLMETPVPEGVWALDRGGDARPPAVEQALQVRALRDVTAAVTGLVAFLAGMIVVGLLRQRSRLQRAESYVHWAMGARPVHLAAKLMGVAWPWALLLLACGALAGLLVPPLLAGTFPGSAEVPQNLAASLVVATGLLVLILRWEAGAGRRSVRGEGWLGRAVSSPASVVAVGFAALTAVGLLARHAPGVSVAAWDADGRPRLVGEVSLHSMPLGVRAAAIGAWTTLAASEGDGRAGLAGAGAARGVGYGTQVWVDCGNCFEGGLPMPVKAVRAELHAVAADTFPHVGLEVLRGRDFDDARDVGEPSVAIVTRAMAVRHFEGGEAVGRRIRVGESEWLTVVGVVGDPPDARDHTEYSVYVPVTQVAPAHLEILAGSFEDLEPWLATAPVEAGSATLRTRKEVFAVHGWFTRIVGVVGGVAYLLVFLGVWLGSRNEARATVYELALRRAVGALNRDIHAHFIPSSARTLAVALAVGVWLSLFFGGGLEAAYGNIPNIDVMVWSRVGAMIALAWIAGGWPSFARARNLPPVVGLRAAASGR